MEKMTGLRRVAVSGISAGCPPPLPDTLSPPSLSIYLSPLSRPHTNVSPLHLPRKIPTRAVIQLVACQSLPRPPAPPAP